jgi:hypothetical protein
MPHVWKSQYYACLNCSGVAGYYYACLNCSGVAGLYYMLIKCMSGEQCLSTLNMCLSTLNITWLIFCLFYAVIIRGRPDMVVSLKMTGAKGGKITLEVTG